MRGTVLVVDDHASARRALANELEDAGFEVVEAADGAEAWEIFRRGAPDVVITDMVMPRSDGLDLLSRIRSQSDVPVILFTARGSVASAASAFKRGADDFIASPDVDAEGLVTIVANAIDGARGAAGLPGLEQRLVGGSRAMTRVRERVAGLAPLRTPVLVIGEKGSGRDATVQALHDFGATAGASLVRVQADTDASAGAVQGTGAVYLDGIERFRSKELERWSERVVEVEDHGFRRAPRIFASLSGVVSAPNHDWAALQQLKGQLLRFSIELPPLRAHAEDIPEIADALVSRIGASVGRRIRLSPSAREFLAGQRWLGNVRHLERVLERATAFSRGRQIRREVVKDVLAELEESLASIREQHQAAGRQKLLETIQETGGNVSQTAVILGKSRAAVYRLIEKYGISLVRQR